jgi:predicted AAA+ superfamily ATPase
MTLPPWWQVTTPHKDIREGKLSEAIFAADLGDVVNGKAPLEYQDAGIFFQKTYLTQGLKNLLDNVLSRLSGGKGDAMIQLQTPFGGGKTHALLTLYHVVKHRKEIEHIASVSELPKVDAKVAVFVGTHADAVSGKTPWGEIASQLGQYEIIKDHDKKRIAPGKEKLRQILDASGPTLILMDEILEYIVKANRAEKVERITHGQTLAFLQEISEVAASSDNCCLVLTLPASILERYDEDAERSLQQLQKVSGRVEAVYTPVEGVEIYEVIRKRLFEDYGDEKTRKKVAHNYFDLYQRLGADVPSEVKEIEYREHIEHAYPFHPELIDVLYERWGSYPTFQRTRGVLRLLAEVVSDLYKRQVVSPLIQSSLVNLENQAIRREFVKHIGNEYDSVISADIAGKNAKAPKIDKEMGSEYEKYGIAKAVATLVFLYSFSAGASKETTLPRIRAALLREGIPATIVGDAVAKLEEELWYFHSERKQYAFRNQPNLNRVIVDREETVSDEKIREEFKNIIQENAGRALEVYLWPEDPSDIPDNKNLKLAILSSDFSYDSDKGKRLATELFEKAGTGFRVYKNTLFILLIDNNQNLLLSKATRRLLALADVQNDKSLLETLTKQSQEELRKKSKETEKEMPFKILTAYRYMAVLEEGGMNWKDLGIPTVGSDQSISERVKQYLKDQEMLLSRLTPKYLLDKTFGKEENEKSLRACLNIPSLA